MLVSDLINEIRLELGDNSANNWSDDELIAYINEGMRYIYGITSLVNPQILMKTTTLTLSAGNNSVNLPTDYWGLINLFIPSISNIPLQPVNATDMNYNSNSGAPTQYYISGDKIVFDCTADVDYSIVFNYIPDVPVLGLSDEIPYKNIYINFIKFYVIIRVWNKNEAQVQVESIFFKNYGQMLLTTLNIQAHNEFEVTEDIRQMFRQLSPTVQSGG